MSWNNILGLALILGVWVWLGYLSWPSYLPRHSKGSYKRNEDEG